MELSRIERDFAAAGDAQLSTTELLRLLAPDSDLSIRQRQEAIACYLSASEGWNEALKALQGTFAGDAAKAVRSGSDTPDKREINQRASEYLQWQALKAAGTDND